MTLVCRQGQDIHCLSPFVVSMALDPESKGDLYQRTRNLGSKACLILDAVLRPLLLYPFFLFFSSSFSSSSFLFFFFLLDLLLLSFLSSSSFYFWFFFLLLPRSRDNLLSQCGKINRSVPEIRSYLSAVNRSDPEISCYLSVEK